MKLNKLSPVALATTLALGGLVAAPAANAGLGYNAAVATMYLWRGQDVSNGPTVNGGIDYSHDSGLYASAWVSSGIAGSVDPTAPAGGVGHEVDLWVGYKGEVSGLGYDISYWSIDYPQSTTEAFNETILGLSYSMFSFGYVSGDGYDYTTLGVSYGPFAAKYGMSSNDDFDVDYSHVDLTYTATDALSFTVSINVDNDDGALADADPLFLATYKLPIDIK